MGIVEALNALGTPWIAILIIVLGMAFDICCKIFGLNSDAASGVIGAGLALLTKSAADSAHEAAIAAKAAKEVAAVPTSPAPGPEQGKK